MSSIAATQGVEDFLKELRSSNKLARVFKL